MSKIWNFADQNDEPKSPYQHLFEYSSSLKDDTGGIIEGVITESISDAREEIVYALYLVVPELKNYSYRLIEITQKNAVTPYPVDMKLFGKANIVEKNGVEYKDFVKTLEDFIKSPLTKLILTHLKTHLEIKREYGK